MRRLTALLLSAFGLFGFFAGVVLSDTPISQNGVQASYSGKCYQQGYWYLVGPITQQWYAYPCNNLTAVCNNWNIICVINGNQIGCGWQDFSQGTGAIINTYGLCSGSQQAGGPCTGYNPLWCAQGNALNDPKQTGDCKQGVLQCYVLYGYAVNPPGSVSNYCPP